MRDLNICRIMGKEERMFNKLIKFDSIAFPLAIERVEMSAGAGIMRITFLFFHIDFWYGEN